MLAQRLLTAAIGIPAIFALILIGSVPYVIAIAVILTVAGLEFFATTDPDEAAAAAQARLPYTGRPFYRQRIPGLFGAFAAGGLAVAADRGFDYWTGAFAITIALSFALLVLRGEPQSGLRDWVWIIAGVAYVGVLGSYLVLLRDLPDGKEWVLLAVFATFIADSCAYFVGRPFGRTRITPAVSPGKTAEGTLAGFAAGFIAVLALNWATGLDVSIWKMLLLAALLPIVGFVGDLAESLIKRGAGVKDSSDLVPGHGGFLDRLDSLLFAVPLVYYFVIWVVL